MAAPLGATALLTALRTEGVHVTEHAGWTTHNRNSKGPWGPVNGVVIHHTAGRDSLDLCWSGMDDLPGPLCHTHLAKNGTATMLSSGRANHAGTFAQNAFDAVVNENSAHPRPDAAEPVDGNAHFYGIEIENLGNGEDTYPGVQYQAAVRWAAAICRAHGWTANSVIGHKEGTRRKIDPSFDMGIFRDAVTARLAHEPGWDPAKEDDVTLTAEDIAKAVWAYRLTSPTAPAGTDPKREAGAYLRYTDAKQQELLAQLGALKAAVAALKGSGASGAITLDQVQEAAEQGAKAALRSVRVTTEGS